MKIIAYLLGFGLIALCTCVILYTRESVTWLKGLFSQYQLRHLAVLPAFFGILFLIAASATAYPWVFRILGLLAFGKAALVFFNPQEIFSRMQDWYFEKVSDRTQRLFGIIGIIFGTAVLGWIK